MRNTKSFKKKLRRDGKWNSDEVPIKNTYFCLGAKRPKHLFKTEKAALQFIESFEPRYEGQKRPVRAYLCPHCQGSKYGSWHVTSQEWDPYGKNK